MESTYKKTDKLKEFFKNANGRVACSAILMGLGQLMYKQIAKGILYIIFQIATILFFVFFGAKGIAGFITLGTVKGNAWYNIKGDDSVIMLLRGLLSLIMLIFYFMVYIANLKDVYKTQKRVSEGKAPVSLRQEFKDLFDKNFYKTALFFPIAGVCIINILPIVFMILIAFTNYGGNIVPPELVDWVGFASFKKLIVLKQFAPTFLKILLWNMIWAIVSTALNYFGGLGIALLYNSKCVKGKAFWRAFPILAYAVPGFITLLAFRFMFNYGGPINQIITRAGGKAIGFLDMDAKWIARGLGFAINAWLNIPTSMLLATGILGNMNEDLLEAAKIDGAGPFRRFVSLTLPFVLFATMPVLISQFIANFNNFGIFYFLRPGLTTDGYFLANDTDLLINWLYNLSVNNNYYSIGAAISIIIFLITSFISLIVYTLSPSYKQEDNFR